MSELTDKLEILRQDHGGMDTEWDVQAAQTIAEAQTEIATIKADKAELVHFLIICRENGILKGHESKGLIAKHTEGK